MSTAYDILFHILHKKNTSVIYPSRGMTFNLYYHSIRTLYLTLLFITQDFIQIYINASLPTNSCNITSKSKKKVDRNATRKNDDVHV